VRKEYTWTGSAWSLTNETRYVYDGLLVLQERDGNNIPVLTYTRGLDLSGSLQGAGGVSGLLALSDQRASASNPTNYYYHADGSGNVTALLNQQNEVVAGYLHHPFGNLLAKSGPMVDFNRVRFSSKEWHAQSGLLLYEFRPYAPNLQRWITQDPLEEAGGINLYRFALNNPVHWIDADGLAPVQNNTSPRYSPSPRPVDPLLRQIEFELQTRGYAEARTMFNQRQREQMREEFLSRPLKPLTGPTSLSAPRETQQEFKFEPTVKTSLLPCPPRGQEVVLMGCVIAALERLCGLAEARIWKRENSSIAEIQFFVTINLIHCIGQIATLYSGGLEQFDA
jgi:RHS repeat-associated protein